MDVIITTIGGFRIIAVPPTLHGGLKKKICENIIQKFVYIFNLFVYLSSIMTVSTR